MAKKFLQQNTEKASLQFISVTCSGSCLWALSSRKALWWSVSLWICCSSCSCSHSRSTTLQGCKWFLLAQGGLTKLHVLFMSQTNNCRNLAGWIYCQSVLPCEADYLSCWNVFRDHNFPNGVKTQILCCWFTLAHGALALLGQFSFEETWGYFGNILILRIFPPPAINNEINLQSCLCSIFLLMKLTCAIVRSIRFWLDKSIMTNKPTSWLRNSSQQKTLQKHKKRCSLF